MSLPDLALTVFIISDGIGNLVPRISGVAVFRVVNFVDVLAPCFTKFHQIPTRCRKRFSGSGDAGHSEVVSEIYRITFFE